jgi:hypothetical protein
MYIYKVFCACVQLCVFYIKVIYVMSTYACLCVFSLHIPVHCLHNGAIVIYLRFNSVLCCTILCALQTVPFLPPCTELFMCAASRSSCALNALSSVSTVSCRPEERIVECWNREFDSRLGRFHCF